VVRRGQGEILNPAGRREILLFLKKRSKKTFGLAQLCVPLCLAQWRGGLAAYTNSPKR
jgi:hypothetical protein